MSVCMCKHTVRWAGGTWSVREGKKFLVLLTERFKCDDMEGMDWIGRTESWRPR